MKPFVILLSYFILMVFSAKAITPVGFSYDTADQVSRTVVHKDGTYTTTQKDKETRTLVRETKKRNKFRIKK